MLKYETNYLEYVIRLSVLEADTNLPLVFQRENVVVNFFYTACVFAATKALLISCLGMIMLLWLR